jgi:flavin reductase (DIM6/NTAB) family NADH-FMN oxidoreductase RutF
VKGDRIVVDDEQFRTLFASFTTGVSIVTALGVDGRPAGFTGNAVCAVSAQPPLLLVCVDKHSNTLPVIAESGTFVVNVLAEEGEAASRIFAGKAPDKFAGQRWVPARVAGGTPILVDVILAYAACVVVDTIEAGDHWIFIARIEEAETFPRSPLVYYQRGYGLTSRARR